MIKAPLLVIGLFAGQTAAAPSVVEAVKKLFSATKAEISSSPAVPDETRGVLGRMDVDHNATHPEDTRGRELFPIYAMGAKCARYCSARDPRIVALQGGDANAIKGPVKALEMLALNDDLNTVVKSDSMCTRRSAMARAVGLAAGLALSVVNAPAFAAETKMVKMGTDSGQLVFQPDEVKVCKGDTVTWVNNKGGPHNVVFDAELVPSGVDTEKISMDEQLGEEGETYSLKFDTAGSYGYYCEPHAGAGMKATVIVSS
jgi:plastocyanin